MHGEIALFLSKACAGSVPGVPSVPRYIISAGSAPSAVPSALLHPLLHLGAAPHKRPLLHAVLALTALGADALTQLPPCVSLLHPRVCVCVCVCVGFVCVPLCVNPAPAIPLSTGMTSLVR